MSFFKMEIFDLTENKTGKPLQNIGIIDLCDEEEDPAPIKIKNKTHSSNAFTIDLVNEDSQQFSPKLPGSNEQKAENVIILLDDDSQQENIEPIVLDKIGTTPHIKTKDAPSSSSTNRVVPQKRKSQKDVHVADLPSTLQQQQEQQKDTVVPVEGEKEVQVAPKVKKPVHLEIDLTQLAQPSLRPRQESLLCKICYDAVPDNAACKCPLGHPLCMECFEGYIVSAKAPGSINYADSEGRLLCFECRKPYDPRTMPAQLFESLQDLRFAKLNEQVLKVELERQEERLRKEFETTLAKDGEERDAHRLACKIRDEILNLKCPACGAVFVDFEGCFALTCGVNSCRAGFCAWCLACCGKDAHTHVAKCAEGKGTYGTLAQFNAHHRLRRQKAIIQLLQMEKGTTVRKRVFVELKKDLKDLSITIPPALTK